MPDVVSLMMSKPPGVMYGVDDAPPTIITLVSGLQHAAVVAMIFAYPIVVAQAAGASPDSARRMLTMSMLVMGIGAILQAGVPGLGSRFLCPPCFTAAYLPGSILAAQLGGLPLVFGMTVSAGALECVLSRIVVRLQRIVPFHVAGVIVVMIGITVGSIGVKDMLSNEGASEVSGVLVGVVTLAMIAALSLSRRTFVRGFSALLGLSVGCGFAWGGGVMAAPTETIISSVPLFELPRFSLPTWSFDANLLVAFAAGALASATRVMGDVVSCQKLNDAEWRRPELRSIADGVLTNGLTTVVAGVLGTIGASTSTANIGLTKATGVASRRVGYAIGAIFFVLACVPRASWLLLSMPTPVMGATLVFTACFIVANGFELIATAPSGTCTPIVIGLPFIVGVVTELHHLSLDGMPAAVRAIVTNSLVTTTLTALAVTGLGCLRRAGAATAARLDRAVRNGGIAASSRMKQKGGDRANGTE